MSKATMTAAEPEIIWKDRKHHMWFPLSFDRYRVSQDRLYTEKGFFSSSYDELLLYRVIDLKLRRNLLQKIFGTGSITICTKADTDREIILKNIKRPLAVKNLISELVETARDKKRVVGKEFFSMEGGPHIDIDGTLFGDDPDIELSGAYDDGDMDE